MLAGPVCHAELVKIARHRRFFVLRTGFGLVLLAILAAIASDRDWSQGFRVHELAALGRSFYGAMMLAQVVAIGGLTPALVADAIASERQRRTLHDLLTSDLTGAEIVLGKLTARMLSAWVLLGLAIPILSLLTLFGGIDPEELLWFEAALVVSSYFMAALAIVLSTVSRSPREAVGGAYALTALWLVAPALVTALVDQLPPPLSFLDAPVRVAFGWAWPASPLTLAMNFGAIVAGGPGEVRRQFGWLIGSLAVNGTALVALASWQLRPAFRRLEDRAGRRRRPFKARRRWLSYPPCGDDPLLWKEAHFARATGGIVGRIARLALPAVLGVIVLATGYASFGAFWELWDRGYGLGDGSFFNERDSFNITLRVVTVALFGVWMIWLGNITAASFTSEREQETWTGLLATPLDGAEILRGKMFGALRATGGFGVTILLLWLLGLASGAVHPLGFLWATLVLVVLVWSVTVFGTYVSLKSKTTWRAQAVTVGTFVLPHCCCLFPVPPMLWIFGFSLGSYSQVDSILGWTPNAIDLRSLSFAFAIVTYYLLFYPTAAFFLTHAVFDGFDAVADRPHRGATDPARALARKPSPGAKSERDIPS